MGIDEEYDDTWVQVSYNLKCKPLKNIRDLH